jgi:hypothetical protein
MIIRALILQTRRVALRASSIYCSQAIISFPIISYSVHFWSNNAFEYMHLGTQTRVWLLETFGTTFSFAKLFGTLEARNDKVESDAGVQDGLLPGRSETKL